MNKLIQIITILLVCLSSEISAASVRKRNHNLKFKTQKEWVNIKLRKLSFDKQISLLLWNKCSESSGDFQSQLNIILKKINNNKVGNLLIDFRNFRKNALFVKKLGRNFKLPPILLCDIDKINKYILDDYILPFPEQISNIKDENLICDIGKVVSDNVRNRGFSAYVTSIKNLDNRHLWKYELATKLKPKFFKSFSNLIYYKKYISILDSDSLHAFNFNKDGFIYTFSQENQTFNAAYSYILIFGKFPLVLPFDEVKAKRIILKSLKKGKITKKQIRNKVKYVLSKKYFILNNSRIARSSVNKNIVVSKAIKNVPVVLVNNDNILPINNLRTKIAFLSITQMNNLYPFQRILNKYTDIKNFSITKNLSDSDIVRVFREVENYETIIVGVDCFCDRKRKKYILDFLNKFKNVIYCSFNSLSESDLFSIGGVKGLIYVSSSEDKYQEAVAQIIFGGLGSSGILSENIGKTFQKGFGLKIEPNNSFGFSDPEEEGIDSKYMESKIDSIVGQGIVKKAFPGCQVLVARNNKIIFHKCYGYHTYDKNRLVLEDDLYDLASITKVVGSTAAIMKLVDDGEIDIDNKFSDYWEGFQGTDKEDLIFRDILAHQARLKPYVQFWKEIIDKYGYSNNLCFGYKKSILHEIEVYKGMFLWNGYKEKLYEQIAQTPLQSKFEYKYSGLSFMLFPEIIKNLTGESFETYLNNTFYKPIGASSMMFNPYDKINIDRVVPTENDIYFRHSLLKGYVHDEGCAMLGGVSGNAGLFSNAVDLAKLMQMFLNNGTYANKRYLSEKVVKEFTKYQFPELGNRRALGFDKPKFGNDTLDLRKSYPAPSVSSLSFGHSGFTGTFTWVDPKYNLLYIFFSNRIYPTRKNNLLYKLKIRVTVQQAIYDAMDKFSEEK